ncbi:spore germination protein [Shouchella shacheensis]|uniref:spore germination protein n=1 Tax=Shouchella shacheensis TaxID=1649580 RepID=UPI00073FFD90|nr:spore germination protein [Shouchella shacheensis]
MFKQKKQQRITKMNQNRKKVKSFEDLLQTCKKSSDFKSFTLTENHRFIIHYLGTMIKQEILHDEILPHTKKPEIRTLFDLKQVMPVEETEVTSDVAKIEEALMTGHVLVQVEGNHLEVLLIPAATVEARSIAAPEIEFSVVGPKEAFVETIDVNLNLIRGRMATPNLIVDEVVLGDLSKTRVAILHVEGITSKENVHTVTQRIKDIHYDQMVDSSFLMQMIADNSNSPFPQMIDTERPDRVSSLLAEGKVAIVVDGSPHVLTAPTTFVEFFSAFEDYFIGWPLASIFRLIRLGAVIFSVLSTAVYVAVVTYHYEMIPTRLLDTLVTSRSGIPFPPIVEAILLELVIELLREAGARLPTKIGQTIGIVGGIVIGTAAVDAGLTSSILLIIVALTALASFTTPVYQMSNTIRLIRFPFILFAQWLGLFGVAMCSAFFLAHLLTLTSLGRPYLSPIYPLRFRDFKDAFILLPVNALKNRPLSLRTQKKQRFKPNRPHQKRGDIED